MKTFEGAAPRDWDITRRRLLAGPVTGVMMTASTTGQAPDHTVQAANVAAFGARGDGRSDDGPAFRAALDAARTVTVPPGSFRINQPITLRDGQSLIGAGRSATEPYTGKGPPAGVFRTEIVADDGLAIDARDTKAVSVSGLAVRTRGGRQSVWGQEPRFQPGTCGLDIAGSLQFDARDISFHGFEVAVQSLVDSGRATQMPHVGEWVAQDCGTVFKFVSNNPDFYGVQDARIDGCLAALHCGRIVEARNCDGLRIENVRFYQCATNSLLIERTPFLSVVGATMFETGEDAVVLRDCQYASFSGTILARAGFFRAGKLVQRNALLVERCADVAFDGLIEQSVGRAVTIRDTVNMSLRGAIGTPFWSTGSLWAGEGAVQVERSRSIMVDASFGGTTYWIAVWADAASAQTLSGRISTEGTAGVVRCVHLQQAPFGHVHRLAATVTVPASSDTRLDQLRLLLPAGRSLVSRSVELTASGVTFAAGKQRWPAQPAAEPGGGFLSLERRVIAHNPAATAGYVEVPLDLHNPTPRPITLPAGVELRLSLGIE